MSHRTGLEIAITGMAGRFPGAGSVEAFWRNLRAGAESISFFSAEELLAYGNDAAEVRDPAYVRARGALCEVDAFDPAFFGYSPREAQITDPQHRLFLECAWEALEDAGYDPLRCPMPVGVYAGAGMSNYLAAAGRRSLRGVPVSHLMIGNDKDHLSTRVSYKLGLEGPSLTIQTACSTSLVAIHVAAQALLNGECDMALAGGVSARLPEKAGYRYQEGMILSPDGHCRAFGAGAQGTVPGHGVGVVVLRRLEDALETGDFIRAVIKGTAINNDGSQKVGYTAPRVEGQARVIRAAQIVADVPAGSITYVEGHGTATPMGDPIEVAALTRAFRATTERKGFCALGSVKSNIGHLDTAAGIAGLIKTTLALQHREIPPSLHAETVNPEIDFTDTPFYVNTTLREWPAGEGLRRAAVSSFGIGGTNAHVILEEAPPLAPPTGSRPQQLLVLSARTETALESATDALAEHLERHPDLDLADVAYTGQVGRHGFAHRRCLVTASHAEAVAALRSRDGSRVFTSRASEPASAVAFLFPGQGAQYIGMGAELYALEPVFRQEIDACCEILTPLLGLDPRRFLVAGEEPAESLEATAIAQPLLFTVEHALARLLGSWGVRPAAMIGHSVGEYVAACLAGVFSLEEALRLVAARGRLMQQQPAGAMLAVPLTEAELRPLLSRHGLELAAVNAPQSCVASGAEQAVQALERELEDEGVRCRRLHTSHAFHSAMMDGALAPFAAEVARIELRAPSIPYLSNRSGTWIRPEEATDPAYWVSHLRQAVRFSEGVAELLRDGKHVLLEVGPGHTLATLVRKQVSRSAERVVLSAMRHPGVPGSDAAVLLQALGRLWAAGVEVDWTRMHAQERRRRVPLPTYPFERQRYRLEPEPQAVQGVPAEQVLAAGADLADRFHVPVWRQAPPVAESRPLAAPDRRWLIFLDQVGFGARVAERLAREGAAVLTVMEADGFTRCGEGAYTLAPGQPEGYDALLADLESRGTLPTDLVHTWNITESGADLPSAERLEEAQERGFWSLLSLAQALGRRQLVEPLRMAVISNDLHPIAGEGGPAPEKATLLGPCLVIPREYPGVSCQSIDVTLPPSGSWQEESLIAAILGEMSSGASDPVVAYRGNTRWVRGFAPVRIEGDGKLPVQDGGTYLITGGLGSMGLDFAELLARQARVRLALLSRSELPEPATAPAEPQGFLAASHAEDRELVYRLEEELAVELAPRDLDRFGDLVPRLNALCASHVMDYLAGSGVGLARGDRRSRQALREALGVLPKFHRFYDYMLTILEEDGAVRSEGDELVFLHGPEDVGDPRHLHADLMARFPGFAGLFDLLAHCAAGYDAALRGDIEAVGVLYPDGERRLLEETGSRTEDHGRWLFYVSLTAELVARMAERAAGRPLRVLEVGAGNGLLTRHLVSRLRSQNLEYWFTDLGRAFVLRAEREAAQQGLGFLRFATLDISQDPVLQGFSEGSFDLVLGLDVVHATKNLVETTSNLRRLLAPGGTLALVERVHSPRWTNLVWGLAEGWWYFEDARRRTTPLLGIAGWEETLREAGYTDIAAYPETDRERSNYALLTGRSPLLRTAVAVSPEAGDVRVRERLARVRQLEASGAEVMVCQADVTDPASLEAAMSAVRQRFGRIEGVIHAAGVLGAGVIQRKSREAAQAVLAPKVAGTLALERLLRADRLDFFVLCSSTSALSGATGQVDYCAANAFLDSFAQWLSLGCGRPAISIDWERWSGKGMAVEATRSLAAGAAAEGRPVAHPLLQRLLHESEARTVFASRLGAGDWVLDDHRLLGFRVLPGTAYLEMARAAFEEITGTGELEIRDVMFWAPLVVREGERAEVYTVLDRAADGFELQVVSAVELDGERRFRRHMTGTVLPLASGEERWQRLDGRLMDLWGAPEAEPPVGGAVETGLRWRALRRRRSDDTEAVGTLRLEDEIAGDVEVYKLHPGLMDVATGLTAGRFPESFYAPLSYRSLRLRAPLASEVIVQVRRRDMVAASQEVFSIDVVIADRTGRILVEIDHFTKKRVAAGQGQEALADPSSAVQGLLTEDILPEIGGELRDHGIQPREGVEALRRILGWSRAPQVVVLAGGQPDAVSATGTRSATAERRPAAEAASAEGPQAVLARIWSEVLGVANVGPHDNFFELGGDSILGLQVVARAKEAGLQLNPSQIFEKQTISELARVLAPEASAGETRTVPPVEPPSAAAAPQPPAVASPPGFPLVSLSEERLSRLTRKLEELDGIDE